MVVAIRESVDLRSQNLPESQFHSLIGSSEVRDFVGSPVFFRYER